MAKRGRVSLMALFVIHFYFWLFWVFIVVQQLSLVVVHGLLSLGLFALQHPVSTEQTLVGGLQPEAHSPAPGRAATWSDFGKGVLFPQLLSMLPSPAQAGGEWACVRVPPSPGCPTPTSRSRGPAPRLLAPSHQQWVHQESTSLTKCGREKPPRGRACAGAHGHLGLLNGVGFHSTPGPQFIK